MRMIPADEVERYAGTTLGLLRFVEGCLLYFEADILDLGKMMQKLLPTPKEFCPRKGFKRAMSLFPAVRINPFQFMHQRVRLAGKWSCDDRVGDKLTDRLKILIPNRDGHLQQVIGQ